MDEVRKAEMSSQQGGDFEGLSGIIPEEVWRVILEKTMDPKTLENLSNASLFFRNELLPRRTTYLFPALWKLLEPLPTSLQHQQEQNRSDDDGEEVNCSDCGRLRSERRYSWILNLRLVCKQWKDAVDSLYEYDNISQDGYNWTRDIRFMVNSIDQFVSHFANTHMAPTNSKNPFIGRSIGLKLDISNNETGWISLQNMLSLYGKHIWDCAVFCSRYMCAKSYERLRVILDLLPNLKRLEMLCSFRLQKTFVSLKNEIRNSPLREFKCLEQVSMSQGFGPLLGEILTKSCKSLKGLEIEYYDRYASVPNLNAIRQINLEYFSSYVSLGLFSLLERVAICSPLKILDLTFTNDCRVPVPRIFSLVEKKITLTNVSLSIHRKENCDQEIQLMCDCRNLKLNLPKLKTFRLYIDFFMSFDFLYPARACLESIELDILFNASSEGKVKLAVMVAEQQQKLKIVDHQYKMMESNVWAELPNLEMIEIQVSTLPDSAYKSSVPNWLLGSGTTQKYFRPGNV